MAASAINVGGKNSRALSFCCSAATPSVGRAGLAVRRGAETFLSVYELNKAVHAIYIDRARAIAFRDGDNSILDRFDLTPDEHDALAARDFPRLWALNVHPMILFHLSAVMNPREWYMQNVIPHIRDVPNHFYDYYKDQYAPGDGA